MQNKKDNEQEKKEIICEIVADGSEAVQTASKQEILVRNKIFYPEFKDGEERKKAEREWVLKKDITLYEFPPLVLPSDLNSIPIGVNEKYGVVLVFKSSENFENYKINQQKLEQQLYLNSTKNIISRISNEKEIKDMIDSLIYLKDRDSTITKEMMDEIVKCCSKRLNELKNGEKNAPLVVKKREHPEYIYVPNQPIKTMEQDFPKNNVFYFYTIVLGKAKSWVKRDFFPIYSIDNTVPKAQVKGKRLCVGYISKENYLTVDIFELPECKKRILHKTLFSDIKFNQINDIYFTGDKIVASLNSFVIVYDFKSNTASTHQYGKENNNITCAKFIENHFFICTTSGECLITNDNFKVLKVLYLLDVEPILSFHVSRRNFIFQSIRGLTEQGDQIHFNFKKDIPYFKPLDRPIYATKKGTLVFYLEKCGIFCILSSISPGILRSFKPPQDYDINNQVCLTYQAVYAKNKKVNILYNNGRIISFNI